MVEGEQSIRQAIYLLLSTSPGERVMRPAYGCELNRLIFSPNDDTTAGLAIHYVRRAIERWEPRVEILRLDAGRDLFSGGRDEVDGARLSPGSESLATLYILLEYRIRATLRVDELIFSMGLTGEALR
jgi:phage baseplate assembly protein W